MYCPQCKSDDIEETGEVDLTLVEPNECRHDFVCCACGCLFQIHYQPIQAVVIGQSERYCV